METTQRRESRRIYRERVTIEHMVKLYCKRNHASKSGSLCLECQELLDYSQIRLTRCPFQENKPTCAKCTIHCYKPVMREKARQVMRYSGPRMLFRHPVLAVFHLLDGFRKQPPHR